MTRRIGLTLGIVATALLLLILAGVVGVLYARPATAQANVGVTGMRQVTVVGHGEVKGRPDTATVQIGVDTEAATSQEALAQNNTQAQAIIAKLKELGIAEKDIQTSNFSISPRYGNDGREVTGYRVSNVVSVTIRNLDTTGNVLDQVVQVGANNIYGVNFSVENPDNVLEQARTAAIASAKAHATQFATAAGATVGQALVISENAGAQPPIPFPMAARAEGAAADSSVPVQAGEQTFAVDVQVTFELK